MQLLKSKAKGQNENSDRNGVLVKRAHEGVLLGAGKFRAGAKKRDPKAEYDRKHWGEHRGS